MATEEDLPQIKEWYTKQGIPVPTFPPFTMLYLDEKGQILAVETVEFVPLVRSNFEEGFAGQRAAFLLLRDTENYLRMNRTPRYFVGIGSEQMQVLASQMGFSDEQEKLFIRTLGPEILTKG